MEKNKKEENWIFVLKIKIKYDIWDLNYIIIITL